MGYEGEQFELLTAYVDGELTGAQRRGGAASRSRRTGTGAGGAAAPHGAARRFPAARAGASGLGRAGDGAARTGIVAGLSRDQVGDARAARGVVAGTGGGGGLSAGGHGELAGDTDVAFGEGRAGDDHAGPAGACAPEIAAEGKADRGLTRADRMTVRSAGKASDELTKSAGVEKERLASAEGRAKSPGPATIESPTESKSGGLLATPAAPAPVPEEKLALADGVDKDEESGLGGGRGSRDGVRSAPAAAPPGMRRTQPAASGFKDKAAGEPESTAAEATDDEALGERFRVFYDERVAEQGESAADGSFEHLLAANVLANADLRQVRAAAFTNRIVVDTDPATQVRLVGRIEGFMAGQNVPNGAGGAVGRADRADAGVLLRAVGADGIAFEGGPGRDGSGAGGEARGARR